MLAWNGWAGSGIDRRLEGASIYLGGVACGGVFRVQEDLISISQLEEKDQIPPSQIDQSIDQSLNQPTPIKPINKLPSRIPTMAVKGQATLRTPRLDLIPLRSEHRPHTMALDMDPLVMKTVAFGRAFTEDEAIQVHTWLMQSAKTVPGFGCWAGFTQDEGEFVGWWILASCSEQAEPEPESASDAAKDRKDSMQPLVADKAEYGFRVAPKFWGKGFAKEGAREMVRHAFQDLELAEVIGETMTVNAASRAVMAGSGLKHVDTFFNTYDTPPAGIEEGEVRYSIRREDWLATA